MLEIRGHPIFGIQGYPILGMQVPMPGNLNDAIMFETPRGLYLGVQGIPKDESSFGNTTQCVSMASPQSTGSLYREMQEL